MQAYDDWVANPTMVTLETTGMPISEVEFPAITVCGQGSIQEVTMARKKAFILAVSAVH